MELYYRYQQPAPALTDYVRTVLIMEGPAIKEHSSETQKHQTNLPLFTQGMPALVCHAIRGKACKLTLYGQSVPDDVWNIQENGAIITYFFKSFCLPCVFNVSAVELNPQPLELNAWYPQKTIALQIQLDAAADIKHKKNVLDQFLLSQLQKNERDCKIIRYATDQMLYSMDADILPKLVEELHLTERTFQRIFKKYVGISPNQYRRICQFQFAFEHLRSNQFDSLTNLAYMHGYSDQSHYIRSFKEFVQTTPHQYLRYGLTRTDEE